MSDNDNDNENKGGRPLKYKTPDLLKLKIDEYFKIRFESKEPVSIIDLSLYLGFCDKQSLIDYSNKNKFSNEYERYEFSCLIKKAKLMCENYLNNKVLKLSHSGAMFILKTGYGYRERDKNNNDISVNLKFDKTDSNL